MSPTIRDATEADLEAMAAIYDRAITRTDAIWLDEPLGPSRFAQRIAHHRDAGDPVVVAVDGGNAVVGYGSFGPFRALAGYAATVEHSVFVADGHQGRGVGQRLLDELVARALAQGRRVMVAAVDGGNDGSIRFHRRNGFVKVGLMPGVGTKRGVARDLVLLQRDLSDDGHRSAP